MPAEKMAEGLVEELSADAAELGCSAELDLIDALLRGRTGAHRQLQHWERHGDLLALVREMIADTRG
jgi:gamma-glutamyl:cysteine ligase YbdK (ATP-grasp superfamily)